MREPLSPTELLTRLKLAVLAEKGLPADPTLPEGLLEAYRARREVAELLLGVLHDLQHAAGKAVALATEGLGRVSPLGEAPEVLTPVWLAQGERIAFVLRRALDLLAEAWIDPLGVTAGLVPEWDLGSCTVSRVLGSEPGVVGTRQAYTDPAVLQFLAIQARVVAEFARASLLDLLAAYARLAGGPVPVEGASAAERVRRLRVRRPLGEPLGPQHLAGLAEAWLATVSDAVRKRPQSPRAEHKRERWLADDGARFRAHLMARQRLHLRRLKVEVRRLQGRVARAARQFSTQDTRARGLPLPGA
jgi:hypothetical protein